MTIVMENCPSMQCPFFLVASQVSGTETSTWKGEPESFEAAGDLATCGSLFIDVWNCVNSSRRPFKAAFYIIYTYVYAYYTYIIYYNIHTYGLLHISTWFFQQDHGRIWVICRSPFWSHSLRRVIPGPRPKMVSWIGARKDSSHTWRPWQHKCRLLHRIPCSKSYWAATLEKGVRIEDPPESEI